MHASLNCNAPIFLLLIYVFSFTNHRSSFYRVTRVKIRCSQSNLNRGEDRSNHQTRRATRARYLISTWWQLSMQPKRAAVRRVKSGWGWWGYSSIWESVCVKVQSERDGVLFIVGWTGYVGLEGTTNGLHAWVGSHACLHLCLCKLYYGQV